MILGTLDRALSLSPSGYWVSETLPAYSEPHVSLGVEDLFFSLTGHSVVQSRLSPAARLLVI